jgi:2-oxoglutarate dehydrogenase E2 component (dihydrolipoamide succinyltransferase)
VGDFVEQDEEITSIETDKVHRVLVIYLLIVQIDVAVNAPEAGTISQWFVSEEDNVEVGQKLCEIDTEGKPSGGTSLPCFLAHILIHLVGRREGFW